MIAQIKKEFQFGLRNSKFLIIIISYLFFAISNPIMMRFVLPVLLKSQFPGMSEEDMAVMIDMTQLGSIASYMSNVFEVGVLIIVFTLCGLVAQDIRENTMVLPICSGKKFIHFITSKFIVFGSFLMLVSITSMLITYVYSGVLFDFDVSIGAVLKASVLEMFYMLCVLALIILTGTLIKKSIASGLVTLGIIYTIQLVGGLFKIHRFLPSGLLVEANLFRTTFNINIIITLLIALATIAISLVLSHKTMTQMEWNKR